MQLLEGLVLFLSLYATLASATSLIQKSSKTSYSADLLRRETLANLAVLLEREAKSMKSMAATIHQQQKTGGAPAPIEERELESAELTAQAGTEMLQTAEEASAAQLGVSTNDLETSVNLDELDAGETKFTPAAADGSALSSRRRRRSLSRATLAAQFIQDGSETRDGSLPAPGLGSLPTSELDSVGGLHQSELTSEEKRLQSLLERR
eukprot:TRINITY_DN102333_c0_g1_i1.p1 TRINITY_DN102333_c0_g1~~TRINITY_DN102333_c0_g1_i1.p1  ORF type:complete len:208 (-),score=41.43 TRINITY_DN102333_c0_g1_i1:194-817(-)